MNIEIITTPNDTLKETGFGKLIACHSFRDAVSRLGHAVKLNVCKTREDLDAVTERRPDLAVLAVKYIPIKNGADIWLSEYFEAQGINYTGSSREVIKFDSDKVLAKLHLKSKGIKTAEFFTAIPGQYKSEQDLPLTYPLFLKPSDAANSSGVDDSSYITNFRDFENKVNSLFALYQIPVLVEEYLDGPEYTIAVAKTVDGNYKVAPIELTVSESLSKLKIPGEKIKLELKTLLKIENNELKTKLAKLTVECFQHLGVRDFGRFDFKTDRKGDCFFLEANLVPGMTFGCSSYPEAYKIEHGLNYDQVISLVLAGGLSRISQFA